jgi:hypothetical protein
METVANNDKKKEKYLDKNFSNVSSTYVISKRQKYAPKYRLLQVILDIVY